MSELLAVCSDLRSPLLRGVTFRLCAGRAGGNALTGEQVAQGDADQQHHQGQKQ